MLSMTESLKVTEFSVEVHSLTTKPFVYYYLLSIISYRFAIRGRCRRYEVASANYISDGIAFDIVSGGYQQRCEKCQLSISAHSFRCGRHLRQRDAERSL